MRRNTYTGATGLSVTIGILIVLFNIALFSVCIWVGIHFITKFW